MSVEDPSTSQTPHAAHPRPDASLPTGASLPSTAPDLEPLSHRIERARLRAEVATLERELVASESQRQAIVGQYELMLEDRRDGDRDESPGGLVGTVRQLFQSLR